MKPLNSSQTAKFLERFDDFKGSEIRSLEILSASEMKLTLAAQDKARDYDWITINLLFTDISDARLVDDSKLAFLDMDEGVTILFDENQYGFSVGSYSNLSSLKDAALYIIAKNIKYDEGAF